MAKKTNPLLEQERRKSEMEQLVKQAQGIESEEKKTKLTIMLTPSDIAKIKKIAIDRGTSVSSMVHDWIAATK